MTDTTSPEAAPQPGQHQTVDQGPAPNPPRRGKTGLIIALVLIVVIVFGGGGVAAFLFRDILLPNKHYTLGLQHLQAKNYDEAEAEFRLCLEDRPDHRRAKGLLAYAVLRTQLEESDVKVEELRDRCLWSFMNYYTQIATKDYVDTVQEKEIRKWLKGSIDDSEREIRNALKEHNIPFRDWVEFKLGIVETAAELYKIRPDPDDPIDLLTKDVSAALLTRSADAAASKFLMDRCANDDSLLTMTLIAGDKMTEYVATEATDKSSFIAEESQQALRLLKLAGFVQDFINDHANLRSMKKSDFPSDQTQIYSSAVLLLTR